MTPEQAGLFWEKVAIPEGCWKWCGEINRDGYGRVKIAGKKLNAHRVAYEHLIGPIPDGLTIDHLCRNRGCVNPAHLEAVTFRENVLRGFGPPAKHARKLVCVRGHNNWRIRLGGGRECRSCKRIWEASAREKKRELSGMRPANTDSRSR